MVPMHRAFIFLLGIAFFFAMPGPLEEAWFLNTQEKNLAAVRLAPNQTGIDSRKVFEIHVSYT